MKNIISNTSKIWGQWKNTGKLERVSEGHKAISIVGTAFGSKHNFYWIWSCRPTAHSTNNLGGGGGFGGTLYATNRNIVIGEDSVKICPSDGDVTSCCGCKVKYTEMYNKAIIIEFRRKWKKFKICYLCFLYHCNLYTNVS